MSSYLNHHPEPRYVAGKAPDLRVSHDWRKHTEARLAWLYGPLHASERASMGRADLDAWNRLGSREAA